MHLEDGWFSNNRTDTSLLVTKLDAFVFLCWAHTNCMSVCDLTWSTLIHDNRHGLTVEKSRTVVQWAPFNTRTHAHISHLRSEDNILNLSYECAIYKKCDSLRKENYATLYKALTFNILTACIFNCDISMWIQDAASMNLNTYTFTFYHYIWTENILH